MGFVPGKRLLLSFMTMLMTFSWRFLVILARRAQCAAGLRRSDKVHHTCVGLVERVGPECDAHKEIYRAGARSGRRRVRVGVQSYQLEYQALLPLRSGRRRVRVGVQRATALCRSARCPRF